jgi:N-acetylneuraminate synthase
MHNNVFVVAEIGQAHDGSVGILHSYIDAIASTGVNAIKFQVHIADAESSIYEPFRVPFSRVDKTRIDYWRRMELTESQWIEVKEHCELEGVEFLCSPFSIEAIEMLERIGVKRYKIASGEVNNHLLLESLAMCQKPLVLSSGMSSLNEIERALEVISRYHKMYALLQCTTKYPTAPEDIGLNVIDELKALFDCPVGLSDHSGSIFPSIAAVARGADIIEVHAVFDKRMFGPDTVASLTIDELKKCIEGIRFTSTMLSSRVDKSSNVEFAGLKNIFEKSLAVRKDLPKGHFLTLKDLETKKPTGHGIPASEFKRVIGKKLVKSINKYSFLKETDIE